MAAERIEAARDALASELPEGGVRAATEQDTVDGAVPGLVVSAAGTDAAATAMRVCAEHELRVVPRGSGSKLTWGARPSGVDVVLDVSGASAVVEHAAGDLVLRAKAGTPLSEIQEKVRAAGQQLAIDHPLPSSTVGGVIATDTSGPGRHSFGGVRDLLIGITVVRADGVVATSGGKVVKNVAGYDLGKLYTGSFGTLGVITEAVFRLHPLCDEQRWIRVRVDEPEAAGSAVELIRASQAMPTAIEIDGTSGGPWTVCAQVEGRPSVTAERAQQLAERVSSTTGTPPEVLDSPPPWWGCYPFDPALGTGLRTAALPAEISALLRRIGETAEQSGTSLHVRGAAGTGVLNVGAAPEADPSTVAGIVGALRERAEYAVLVCAPEAVRELVDPWGPITPGPRKLMTRVKDQFDPQRRLAPGRFVGGI